MAKLPSGLPEQIADDEDLARFLTQSSHYNSTMVKPAAFLPNPKDRETSVSRHGAAPVERLWELGLAAAGTRTLHGAAIFKAKAVHDARLEVAPDEPPERHAVIRGWPWIDSDPEFQKARQKESAAVLAGAAGKPFMRAT
jgi:hypothetical protein